MTVLGALCTRQSLRLGKTGIQLQQLKNVPSKWLTTTACVKSAPQPLAQNEDFWDKNKRLSRPMSPHLTIYKMQITSVLSITHRGTGLAMSALMSGFAIGMMMLPHNFPHYIQLLCASTGGSAVMFATKFILAFPFMFHLANGVRHLAWDLGKGFKLRDLYMSGYAVVVSSVILSLAAAAM